MTHTALVSHPDCWLHSMGAEHPESPERLTALYAALSAAGLDKFLSKHEAPEASRAQLYRAHAPAYVDALFELQPEHGIVHLDPDTAFGPHTLKAALRAAGAGILATELVVAGKVRNAFCAVRPPGHHAERLQAMGFCFFNNIAVAARHAIEVLGLSRVAIIDFDVHHGNGTENIFAADPRVLMVGFFQHPLFPYSGLQPLAAHLINVALPSGSTGERMQAVFEAVWLPALLAHRPQMLFVSAGFDAHCEDEMASLGMVDADFAWISQRIRSFAEAHCEGRIVSTLEGGYNLDALGRCVALHLAALSHP
jgi:acetoin utilization deacetylase AcuC-like enzyme